MDVETRHERLSPGYRMVAASIRPLRAAKPKRAGALRGRTGPLESGGHHANGRAASFLQSALDHRRRRLDERDGDSCVRGLCPQTGRRAEGPSLSLEYVQRTGHLRLPGLSAGRISAAAQMATGGVP